MTQPYFPYTNPVGNPTMGQPQHNQVMPNPTPVPQAAQPLAQPPPMPQITPPQVPAFGARQMPDIRARIAQALAMRQQMNPNFNPAQFGFPNA